MKILREKQYAAFAANAKTLDSLRRNEVSYVPGVYEVAKVIILSKEDFEKLSEDVSPEYPFLKDNGELMSADPGGLFRCLMVRAEGEKENMLIAQRKDTLYLGYGRDYRSIDLQGVPEERIALEEPKAYQEHAVFYHRPSHITDLNGQNPLRPVPERETRFQVEQVVVLSDEQFRQFQKTGLKDDQIFLFDYSDKMWFDPGSFCWHCVLVKGENSRSGILVDAEGYSYARYAAFAPDCGKLRLRDVPVHYETPLGKSQTIPESEKKRSEHFASFVGLRLDNPAASLHFLKYDADTDIFTVRHQGGPKLYMDEAYTPEELAEVYHFSTGIQEIFFNMDYLNTKRNSEYFQPAEQSKKQKRNEPER